jgi:ATP-dependent Clp protease ATP-binding subunit ClpA
MISACLLLLVCWARSSSAAQQQPSSVAITSATQAVLNRAIDHAKERKNVQVSPAHVALAFFDERSEAANGFGTRVGSSQHAPT